MAEKLACRICVISIGITTQDLFDSQGDLNRHLVAEHGYKLIDEPTRWQRLFSWAGLRHIGISFEPRDLWIGVYWDRESWPARNLNIWICLIPMLPIHLEFE